MSRAHREDWTQGPARIAAAGVLIAASLGGLAWALARPHEAPVLRPAAEVPGAADGGKGAADAGSPQGRPGTIAGTINVNAATAAELELLPGIGPAMAERIIADRQANGPFRTVEDLDRVRGIGPRTLEKLRPLVRVE